MLTLLIDEYLVVLILVVDEQNVTNEHRRCQAAANKSTAGTIIRHNRA